MSDAVDQILSQTNTPASQAAPSGTTLYGTTKQIVDPSGNQIGSASGNVKNGGYKTDLQAASPQAESSSTIPAKTPPPQPSFTPHWVNYESDRALSPAATSLTEKSDGEGLQHQSAGDPSGRGHGWKYVQTPGEYENLRQQHDERAGRVYDPNSKSADKPLIADATQKPDAIDAILGQTNIPQTAPDKPQVGQAPTPPTAGQPGHAAAQQPAVGQPAATPAPDKDLSDLVSQPQPNPLGPAVAPGSAPLKFDTSQQLQQLMQQDNSDKLGASMIKNAPKLMQSINQGSTLLQKPRLPEGSKEAPQNQPEAMEGVHPYETGASFWQNARSLGDNASNDLEDAKRVGGAFFNNLVERYLNETKPAAQGGRGRGIMDQEDVNSIAQGLGSSYHQLHNTYLAAHPHDVLRQLFNHPVGAAFDLGAVDTAVGAVAKNIVPVAKAAERAHRMNLYKSGGRDALGLYNAHKRDITEALQAQAHKWSLGGAADAIKANRMIKAAMERAHKKYLEAAEKMFKVVEENAKGIPPEIMHRLMAGDEWTDASFAHLITKMPRVQRFLQANDTAWSHLEEYLGFTADQKLVARYGPVLLAKYQAAGFKGSMRRFYEGGNPRNGVSEAAKKELLNLKAQMDASDHTPHYNAILTKDQVEQVFSNYRDKLGDVNREEATHFRADRAGSSYPIKESEMAPEEHAKYQGAVKEATQAPSTPQAPWHHGAAEANSELRNTHHEQDIVRNTQAALAEALRIKHTYDALQALADNPKFPNSWKFNLSVKADKILGEGLKLAEDVPRVDAGNFLKMPPAVAKWVSEYIEHTGTDIVNKVLGPLATWYKIMLLGSDPLRLVKQFPQTVAFYMLGAIKTPADLRRAAVALMISTNPQMAERFVGQVKRMTNLVKDEQGAVANIRDFYNSSRAAKLFTPIYAMGQLLKANTDFVNKLDDMVRTQMAVHLTLAELDKMGPEAAKFWDGAFKLSAEAQENLEKIISNPVYARTMTHKLNAFLGEYARRRVGLHQAIANTFLWTGWGWHSLSVMHAARADRPLLTAFIKNYATITANAAQDRTVLTDSEYRQGGVNAKGANGPVIGPNQKPLVYSGGQTYSPLMGLEIISDAAKMGLRSTVSGNTQEAEAETDKPGLQLNLPGQLAMTAWQIFDPKKFNQPRDPNYQYDGQGHARLRSEVAKQGMNAKEVVEPVPRADVLLGKAIFSRMWQWAAEDYERQVGGKPSQFTAPPLEVMGQTLIPGYHAPQTRHQTSEEQAATVQKARAEHRPLLPTDALTVKKPLYDPKSVLDFLKYEGGKSFYPHEEGVTREDAERMKEGRDIKAVKKEASDWIPLPKYQKASQK